MHFIKVPLLCFLNAGKPEFVYCSLLCSLLAGKLRGSAPIGV